MIGVEIGFLRVVTKNNPLYPDCIMLPATNVSTVVHCMMRTGDALCPIVSGDLPN